MVFRKRQGSLHLTRREHHVVRLVYEGLSNREIAERLNISPFTVRDYVSGLLTKLGARNRTDLLSKIVELRRSDHQRIPPS